jgi:hypothetical protein
MKHFSILVLLLTQDENENILILCQELVFVPILAAWPKIKAIWSLDHVGREYKTTLSLLYIWISGKMKQFYLALLQKNTLINF